MSADGQNLWTMRRASQYASALAREFHVTLLLAAIVGVATGLGVAGFEKAMQLAIDELETRPVWLVALTPAVGLLVANVLVRRWSDGDAATTDAFVRAYHQRDGQMPASLGWRTLVASAATIGSGNAFGLEGPSMLIGGTVGSEADRRAGRRWRTDDAKVLMVAGAAAGVAAVFKAPLTGVIFAIEVPYRSDLARRALLPCLAAAGCAYLTFVAIVGTEPLLATGGTAPFDLRDLGGSLALGVICGVLARLGAHAIGAAKRLAMPVWTKLAIAAAGMAALAPVASSWFDAPLQLGPSYSAIEWAADPRHGAGVLCGLFAVRAAATWFGVMGGGAGGLFIPLVTQGAIVGSLFDRLVDAPNPRLFPTIGIAAFLGAGYRTPLAAVAFVAEATGEPGFLVPALLAAAVAQLLMGSRSFSSYQRRERLPDVAPLAATPTSQVMNTVVETVDADLPADSALERMLAVGHRWVPVVRDGMYVGVLSTSDISRIAPGDRPELMAGDVMREGIPTISPQEDVLSLAARFRSGDAEAIAVVESNRVVGIVTRRDLAAVELLLDRLQNESG